MRSRMDGTADVIVIGGGVIGLTTAWELAGQGVSVRVLEKGRCGQEASWAGAGIVLPGNSLKADTPDSRLRAISFEEWPKLSELLAEETGIDNGLRGSGSLEVRFDAVDRSVSLEIEHWRSEGIDVEELDEVAIHAAAPALSDEIRSGYHLPAACQVRNPRHLKALRTACVQRGVEFIEGCTVTELISDAGRVSGVRTTDGQQSAAAVCVCAGAWAGHLLETAGFSLPITPVRGQIVMLRTDRLPHRQLLQHGPRYIVPRPDGRVLVGSTQEWAGFEKVTTAGAVSGLIEFAVSLVPQLQFAGVEKAWAGLRPGSPDGLPFLGRSARFDNLFIAAGHFRSGLQNSPATAMFLRQLILGGEPCLPELDFSPDRGSIDVARQRRKSPVSAHA